MSSVDEVQITSQLGGDTTTATGSPTPSALDVVAPEDDGPESSWLIGVDKVEIGEPISAGAHGEVFKGWMGGGSSGPRRAIAVKKFACTSTRSRDCFRREVSLLSSFKHPSILPFYGAVVTEDLCAILIELCDDNLTGVLGSVDVELSVNAASSHSAPPISAASVTASLDSLSPPPAALDARECAMQSVRMPKWEDAAVRQAVRDLPQVPWTDRLRWAHQLARALHYLHSREPFPIVHRDLKSLNILLCRRTPPTDSSSQPVPSAIPPSMLDVRLCDFGMARTKEHTNIHTQHIAGSPGWMAPEVLRGDDFNDRSDVYSFGVVLWELLMRRVPWGGKKMPQLVGKVGFSGAQLPGVLAIPHLDELLNTTPLPNADPSSLYTTSYYAQCLQGAPTMLYLQLMHRCLQYDPACRPSIDEVLRSFDIILCGVD